MMMKYPIGIYDFEQIRKEGYLYVDKTAMIYDLVNTGFAYYWSRPRFFGKSLLLSTLRAYLQGKKELFDGLAIERLEQKWTVHPVLHLDFNGHAYDSEESLTQVIDEHLRQWEELYKCPARMNSLEGRLQVVMQAACERTGQRAAFLVDGCDEPLLQTMGNPILQERLSKRLLTFYSVQKSMGHYLKIVLLAGVARLGVNEMLIGGPNNLCGITTHWRYNTMAGITEQELHHYFEKDLQELAVSQRLSYEAVCEKLKEWYGGYYFGHNSEPVYNLYSLLNVFRSREFHPYWAEDSVPVGLRDLLKNKELSLGELLGARVRSEDLDGIFGENELVQFLFHNGFLTIKEYDLHSNLCTLDYPNKEAEEGLAEHFFPDGDGGGVENNGGIESKKI